MDAPSTEEVRNITVRQTSRQYQIVKSPCGDKMLIHHIPCCICLVKFHDLDTSMRNLLMRAQLSEDDLKGKDVAEAVECIINQIGGVKAVQRELRKKGALLWKMSSSVGSIVQDRSSFWKGDRMRYLSIVSVLPMAVGTPPVWNQQDYQWTKLRNVLLWTGSAAKPLKYWYQLKCMLYWEYFHCFIFPTDSLFLTEWKWSISPGQTALSTALISQNVEVARLPLHFWGNLFV